MLSIAYPWVVWLLPLPLLIIALRPARQGTGTALRVPFMPRLQELLGSDEEIGGASRSPWQWALLTLLWLLALGGLARPQWLEPPITRTQPTRDLLLLVDLSGSMQHEDFTNAAEQKEDRLSAVKEVLGEFLERRQGDRVGLVVFGDAPFVQAPFTADLALVRQLLDEAQVGMAGPRTALGDAMGLGIRMFESSDLPTKTMIALTDGNDAASKMPPEKAAEIAATRGLTVHTIVVGDPTAVGEEKIDEPTLRKVAQTTGGQFYTAQDRATLARIYTELDRLETVAVKSISHRPRRELFWVPVAALLVGTMLVTGYAIARSLISERQVGAVTALPARIKVNSRTGELEVSTP